LILSWVELPAPETGCFPLAGLEGSRKKDVPGPQYAICHLGSCLWQAFQIDFSKTWSFISTVTEFCQEWLDPGLKCSQDSLSFSSVFDSVFFGAGIFSGRLLMDTEWLPNSWGLLWFEYSLSLLPCPHAGI
jgi:hypothetical protein